MIRIATYNIWNGGEDRLPEIESVIRSMEPDAVALLEATSRSNVEAIARTADMGFACGEANSEFAIAWLSRLPILRSENHALPILAKTLLEIEVAWNGMPLALFATHLAAGRAAADAAYRAREIGAILPILGACPAAHLLVGDFNAVHPGDRIGAPPPGETAAPVPSRPIELLVEAGYVDAFRSLHPEDDGFTYRADHPWLRLDYVFAAPTLAEQLDACAVVTLEPAAHASDHYPVVAELS